MAPGTGAAKAAIDSAAVLDRIQAHWLAHLIHDLSNSLFAARGYLRMALEERDGSLTPLQRRYLVGALDNIAKLTDLTQDIRDFPRRDGLAFDAIGIGDVLQQAAADLRPALVEKNVRLVYDGSGGSLLTIGDGGKLSLALRSFLTAAITFAGPGGVVRIQARQEGETITVQFSSTSGSEAPGGQLPPDLSTASKLCRLLGGDATVAYTAGSDAVISCDLPTVGPLER